MECGVVHNDAPNVNERVLVITAGIGLFLSTLDTGIINVALPTLSRVLHTSVTTIAWTVTLYTIALTGTIIIFGRLSDRYGRLRIYTLGLILFALFSALCGLSHSAAELIAFRTIQGIGAAMLQATAAAIITTSIPPHRRGSALGTLGVLMGLGPVLGPSVGGVLISLGGWPWIFWINLPIALTGLIGCRYLFRRITEEHSLIQLNVSGNTLLSLSMLALLQGLAMWPSVGLSKPMTYIPLGIFIMVFILFLINQLYVKQPIVDLHLFSKGRFSAPMLAIFVFGGASSMGFIIPPFFLERVTHLTPWQVGLVNLSSPLGIVLLSKVSGRLMDRWGTTRLMVTGLIIMFISYTVLGQMQVSWNPLVVSLLLLLYGAGGGLFLSPNIAAIMSTVARDAQGTIGAVQRMVQNLGIAVYTAVAAALLLANSNGTGLGLIHGFHLAWDFAAATILCSIIMFLTTYSRYSR
ncbi:MFS transporter [Alicyclobacillus sp. SO9]|uniref:MFS transporter n=1 Tax=Alicyclobacillus sp. SO9 TaxID=2665646 RepID=UPI0018E77154|nr:MFS transporter [Alicyclobacillus sp. SO9]QQE80027.1 MFS transporter [Alicyclobacillus sp. SO9]